MAVKTFEQLSAQELADICRNKNSDYDGQFVLAVKSTGIFCRPSCKARTPLEKNMSFYRQPGEAKDAGFRACKRCRPDLAVYEPEKQLAHEIKSAIDKHFTQKSDLDADINSLRFSQNHLTNVFKKHFDITPVEYRNKLRFDYVCGLLAGSDMKILDISLAAGFETQSVFYDVFKKYSNLTPGEYREQNQYNKKEVTGA